MRDSTEHNNNEIETKYLHLIYSIGHDEVVQGAQLKYLIELSEKHFSNELCREIFKCFCRLAIKNTIINPGTFGKQLIADGLGGKIKEIMRILPLMRLIDLTPDIDADICMYIEKLKIAAISRKYEEKDKYDC